MSEGKTRALLYNSIVNFDYNGFQDQLAESINLSYIGTEPEIDFNPESHDNFILAFFYLVGNDSKKVIAKFSLQLRVFKGIKVPGPVLLEGSLIGYHNLVQAFIDEFYRQFTKIIFDKNKQEMSVKKLIRLQKKKAKGKV
jgi:hypothetical protein